MISALGPAIPKTATVSTLSSPLQNVTNPRQFLHINRYF